MDLTESCLTKSSVRKNVNTNLTTLMVDGDIVRNETRKEEELHLPTKVCEDGTETIKKDEDEPRNKTSTGTPAARRPSVAGQDTSPRGDRDRRQRDAGSLPTRAGNAAGVADYTEPGRGAAGVAGTGTPAARRPSVAGQDTSPQGDRDSQQRGAAVDSLFAKHASLMGCGQSATLGKCPMQALEHDEKDPANADFDPERSSASQVNEPSSESQWSKADPPLKDDPELMKYFKASNAD